MECILFAKTHDPIDPVTLCKSICRGVYESLQQPMYWRSRYLNRLIPVSGVAKVTDNGVEELGRKVLSQWFNLNPKLNETSTEDKDTTDNLPAYSVRLILTL